MDSAAAAVERVTAGPPRPVRRVLLTQQCRDVTFLHWPADPGRLAPLMPRGVRPDTFDGASYVRLIALRMHQVGFFGLPGFPYLGSFPEFNVRLYSVGPDGRRGVVFCSMDAARLTPVAVARAGLRLPYLWARMRVRRDGDAVTYTSVRRWPGPRAALRLAIRAGPPIAEPSALEHFLTARWGLHGAWHGGGPFYLPNEHPPWPLHQAQLTDLSDELIVAAGLPACTGEPVSVSYSPESRFGQARRSRCAGETLASGPAQHLCRATGHGHDVARLGGRRGLGQIQGHRRVQFFRPAGTVTGWRDDEVKILPAGVEQQQERTVATSCFPAPTFCDPVGRLARHGCD
jgi:uncharacterized protein